MRAMVVDPEALERAQARSERRRTRKLKQSASWWKAAEIPERWNRKHGEVVSSLGYRSGTMQWWIIGKRLGWVYLSDGRHMDYYQSGESEETIARIATGYSPIRAGIYSLGMVYWGNQKCALAAAPGCLSIFLARNGEVWRFPSVQLPEPAPFIRDLPEEEQRVYADAVTLAWAEAVEPVPVRALTQEAVTRYHDLVRAQVRARILDAGAAGETRTETDYARYICKDWTHHDLVRVRHPTVLHALLVSLVLSLDAAHAKYLLYFAGLCEYRLPILTEETAARVYQEAVRLLAQLCPSWWARSYLWDWSFGGTLDEILRDQWCRMVNAAWGGGRPLPDIMGAAPAPVDGVLTLKYRPASEVPVGPERQAPRRPQVAPEAEEPEEEEGGKMGAGLTEH